MKLNPINWELNTHSDQLVDGIYLFGLWVRKKYISQDGEYYDCEKGAFEMYILILSNGELYDMEHEYFSAWNLEDFEYYRKVEIPK